MSAPADEADDVERAKRIAGEELEGAARVAKSTCDLLGIDGSYGAIGFLCAVADLAGAVIARCAADPSEREPIVASVLERIRASIAGHLAAGQGPSDGSDERGRAGLN